MGRFSQRVRICVTASTSRYSGLVQDTLLARPRGARSCCTASATSLGSENHCGEDRLNCWA
ncbi:hypothetical protein [Roseateles chitosanitabidus]|uniref:hypothetical protein n=1 Tax=Roseateles chitosanitabidus TaxID=65048 RepID=UPI001FDF53A9|nr:hypothetical protein [Roseateles chitosanitabidus]